ncbi:MAG: hypothetical protein V9E98_00635 [Candidatus Nanopelagicales bacterium]
MSQSAPVQRPGSVTFIVVLMWILAIFEVIGGIAAVLVSFKSLTPQQAAQLLAEGVTDLDQVRLAGIITIIFGILIMLFASGLKNGSNGARIFISIIVVLNILGNALGMGLLKVESVWSALLSIVLWLIVLAMLWTSRASAFFHSPR